MEFKEINKTPRGLMETSEGLEKLYCAVNFYCDQFIFPLELVDLTVNII